MSKIIQYVGAYVWDHLRTPLNSLLSNDGRIILHDGFTVDQRRLRVDITRLTRPRRGPAFLTARETATGAVELSEVARHLSAGMFFAGYGSAFPDGRVPDSREVPRTMQLSVCVRAVNRSSRGYKLNESTAEAIYDILSPSRLLLDLSSRCDCNLADVRLKREGLKATVFDTESL
ncbi:hypothetical protein HD554DRAFT_2176393 [Boletus coccyginus]|nr:hypothetical protein HD554DRAFT_2176393 [Boletus coccyginus]